MLLIVKNCRVLKSYQKFNWEATKKIKNCLYKNLGKHKALPFFNWDQTVTNETIKNRHNMLNINFTDLNQSKLYFKWSVISPKAHKLEHVERIYCQCFYSSLQIVYVSSLLQKLFEKRSKFDTELNERKFTSNSSQCLCFLDCNICQLSPLYKKPKILRYFSSIKEVE